MSAAPAPLSSEARLPTAVPRRYLAQLCKHFQHQLPVTFDAGHGRIEFAMGACELEAGADAQVLLMRVTAHDEAALVKLENIVARHLERFAFREQPGIRWTRAA